VYFRLCCLFSRFSAGKKRRNAQRASLRIVTFVTVVRIVRVLRRIDTIDRKSAWDRQNDKRKEGGKEVDVSGEAGPRVLALLRGRNGRDGRGG
jgi:hypothetical protein